MNKVEGDKVYFENLSSLLHMTTCIKRKEIFNQQRDMKVSFFFNQERDLRKISICN
jgi:hypothetical protein